MTMQRAIMDKAVAERLDEALGALRELERALERSSTSGAAPRGAARALIRNRRERERLFGGDLFADPAWDLLLDLYAAEEEGSQATVFALCRATPVPDATARRWVAILSQRGLVERRPDPAHIGSELLRMTPAGRDKMREYLAARATHG